MRRDELEVTNIDEIINIIDRSKTVRLGLNDGEYPYIVPLAYGYEVIDNKIYLYIHGAKEGKKHDLINKSNKAFVELDICEDFVKTSNGTITCEYECVMAQSSLEILNDEDAGHALDLIVSHCGYDGFEFDHSVVSIIDVYKIPLENLTAKRRKL